MSFGKNPHVAKAQAAEQKAQAARDEVARVLAWREAARLWDRAAERETQDKKRREYEQLAEAARAGFGDGAGVERTFLIELCLPPAPVGEIGVVLPPCLADGRVVSGIGEPVLVVATRR